MKTGKISLAVVTNPLPVRKALGLTQEQFCGRFDISLSTLRNWEQGSRIPHGATATFLSLVEHFPNEIAAMVEALRD